MSKVSNILMMIELLGTGRKYSVLELARELEVTPRMVRVYKDEIEKAGIYIETIKGPYGGYILNQKVSLPKRFVKEDISMIDKNYFNLFSRAIKEKKKCEISYYSQDRKKVTKRVIHPYEVLLLDNKWGVAGYCEMREEVRHFYFERIIMANILDKYY